MAGDRGSATWYAKFFILLLKGIILAATVCFSTNNLYFIYQQIYVIDILYGM